MAVCEHAACLSRTSLLRNWFSYMAFHEHAACLSRTSLLRNWFSYIAFHEHAACLSRTSLLRNWFLYMAFHEHAACLSRTSLLRNWFSYIRAWPFMNMLLACHRLSKSIVKVFLSIAPSPSEPAIACPVMCNTANCKRHVDFCFLLDRCSYITNNSLERCSWHIFF